MYQPRFDLRCFDDFSTLGEEGVQRKLVVLRALLEALIVADWQYLEVHPNTPSLYEFLPRYVVKTRPGGVDSWQDLPETIALGTGDCKDFSCIRVAELRKKGFDDIRPFIKVAYYPDPSGRGPPLTIYHIQVSEHGAIDDPSARLGMPKSVTYAELSGAPVAAGMPNARWGHQNWPMAAGVFNHVPQCTCGGMNVHAPWCALMTGAYR
jgi:hypothetical protein